MKKISLIILSVILINILSFASENPVKHALIIAVANYPEEGGWSAISSDNDIALIKNALIKQGFTEENISIIIDDEADKKGMVSELSNLSIRVNEGDIVVVHFSGHGQQIRDNENNDEIDGYDEALIPYDAQVYFSTAYRGENHLRDDEITLLLNNIRTKIGKDGNILVILDSCHSGTGTRGLSKSRGTSIKFEEPGYSSPEAEDQDNFSEIEESENNDDLASMVVISGASQEELNYEYFDKNSEISYGSLSYSLSKALSEANPETTYRALFDMIQVEMSIIAPKQSPQIEGDIDMKIFGGQAVDQQPYFMIESYYDEKTVTINAGNLMGIFDGTEVGFYEINTSDPTKAEPKTTGKIINSSAVESDIIITGTLSEEDAKNSWIFITNMNFGDMSIKVKIENLKNKALEDKLSEECDKLATVDVVNKDPELIIEKLKGETIQIITTDELVVYELALNETSINDAANKIIERLKGYTQANLLKNISMTDPDLNVTFEIIPVTVKKAGSRFVVDERLSLESKLKNGNQLEFSDGDPFKIKVRNDGYTEAYYQIIDIQPDNNINILIPGQNRTAAEYIIYPGEEKELGEIFVFGEPYGTEIFKLVATSEPIDLSMIVTTRGAETKGFSSPFEQLFAESYKQTRAGTLSVPPSSVNVFSVPFKVVEK